MIYARDFARLDSNVWLLVFCVCVVGITHGGMRLLQKLDKSEFIDCRVSCVAEVCLILLGAEVLVFYWGSVGKNFGVLENTIIEIFLLSVFMGCLLSACIMDVESHMIYNFVWWVAWLVSAILLCFRGVFGGLELLLFILLQEVIFARLYGRADCHAFVACALVERALGMSMKEYLLHMLLAYTFLAIVQGLQRNIGRNGNLKKPVPFLPYIAVSFWVLISWEKSAIFIRV